MLERAERQGGHRDAGRVWGGTFHAVANRLLRIHGRTLGLSPGFTVLDQSDGADVMNLLREELGFASRERRFPRKETLAQIHSRVVNAGREARRRDRAPLPVVHRRDRRHPPDLPRLRRTQARAADARLRRPAAVLEGARRVAADRPAGRRDVRPHPGRRVPGHERAAGRHPRGDAAGGHAAEPHGGRRRRAGDLRVPRRDRAQHPRVPRAVPGGHDRQARAQLPLDRADPRPVQRGDRAVAPATREDPVDRAHRRRDARPCRRAWTRTTRPTRSAGRCSPRANAAPR